MTNPHRHFCIWDVSHIPNPVCPGCCFLHHAGPFSRPQYDKPDFSWPLWQIDRTQHRLKILPFRQGSEEDDIGQPFQRLTFIERGVEQVCIGSIRNHVHGRRRYDDLHHVRQTRCDRNDARSMLPTPERCSAIHSCQKAQYWMGSSTIICRTIDLLHKRDALTHAPSSDDIGA